MLNLLLMALFAICAMLVCAVLADCSIRFRKVWAAMRREMRAEGVAARSSVTSAMRPAIAKSVGAARPAAMRLAATHRVPRAFAA